MDLLESLSSVRTYSDFIREKVDRAKSKEEPRWQRFEVEQFICPQTRTAADRLDQLAVLIPDTVRPESNIDLDLTRLLSLLREAAQIIDGGDEGFKFDSLFNLRRVKEDLSRAGLRVI